MLSRSQFRVFSEKFCQFSSECGSSLPNARDHHAKSLWLSMRNAGLMTPRCIAVVNERTAPIFDKKLLGNTSTASVQGITIANKQPSEILLTKPSITLVLFKPARLARPLTFSHKAKKTDHRKREQKTPKSCFVPGFFVAVFIMAVSTTIRGKFRKWRKYLPTSSVFAPPLTGNNLLSRRQNNGRVKL